MSYSSDKTHIKRVDLLRVRRSPGHQIPINIGRSGLIKTPINTLRVHRSPRANKTPINALRVHGLPRVDKLHRLVPHK